MRGVVIDLETGGLDPENHAVTEIGAVCFDLRDGKLVEVDSYHTTVLPDDTVSVRGDAARIQGRTIAEIYSATTMEYEALDGLLLTIGKHLGDDESGYDREGVLWAHNAQFDLSFLAWMEQRVYRKARFFRFRDSGSCTRRIAQNLMGIRKMQRGGVKLDQLCEHFAIPVDRTQRHGALYDARLTLQLMNHLLPLAGWL